jgi:mRNA-degrading endonuclease toxin of MazEF toxin-antitoxin module
MIFRQWEIWKSKPGGFERDHWFVIISPQERLNSTRHHQVNGLVCFTLRGEALPTDVRLNHADGFERATVCQCDLIYLLEKGSLHSPLGTVTWERQQHIKTRCKEVFRF